MITKNGPRVLEYNVRFGDPETQSLVALLDCDLAQIMVASADGKLQDVDIRVSHGSAATVVVAAPGYPDAYPKGIEMKLDDTPDGKHVLKNHKLLLTLALDVTLFHAGTSLVNSTLKTSGGRVIAATATSNSLKEAIKKAYDGVACINFDGMQYRKDIGARALR
jgi:phosphoribosylamine-glycine ligase